MSCQVCVCNQGIPNSGFACSPLLDITNRFVFVNTYRSAGIKNRIDLSDTINTAFFTTLINESRSTYRWFPTPQLKDITDERAESKYFDFTDGTRQFLQQGSRSVEAKVPGLAGEASPQMLSFFDALKCTDLSVYIISNAGQLIGKVSSDGLFLEPFKVDAQSLSATFVKASPTVPQHILLRFDFAITEKDSNIRMIDCDELGGADLLSLTGLLDLTAVLTDKSVTGFTMTLETNYGTLLNPVLATGFLAAEVYSSDSDTSAKVYNETDSLDVNVTSLTETSDGVYDMVFPAQDAGDVLTFYLKKNGYAITDVTYTVVTS